MVNCKILAAKLKAIDMRSEIIVKKPRKVLGVFAHPTGAEFIIGGTLARWPLEGSEISCAACIDGSNSDSDS